MFKCKFGDKIQNFIEQKINAGALYESNKYLLKEFDRFVCRHFNDSTTITRDCFEEWIASKPFLKNSSINRRVPVLRQLGLYLVNFFPETYIIPFGCSLKCIKYQVHLITKKELKAFFDGVTVYCKEIMSRQWQHQILEIPVVFRMLYACGMRSHEVLRLQCDDVNLETGKVIIRESKSHKMRVIYMHPQLTALCRDYDQHIEVLCQTRKVFFCNCEGLQWSHGIIGRWFHNIWDGLPESKEQKGNPFTPHSFRHNFALTVLNRWYREGKDLNVMLPYLAEYMGHSDLEALNYYLHLTEDFSPDIEKAMSTTNEFVLPEVSYGKI